MAERVQAPPTDPIGAITLPVRLPERGLYKLTPLLRGQFSTGERIFPIDVNYDEQHSTLHVHFGDIGETGQRNYIVAFADLIEALGDIHARHIESLDSE